uniref:AAA+ ATPase domain-containing protein n=1 Tax=Strigamia maritima TaxID=126957 RepID=T1IUF3_STRMM
MEQNTAKARPSLKRPNSSLNQNPNKRLCTGHNENSSNTDTVKNFRRMPIIPTIDELKNKVGPVLMENIIDGPFKDVDHYLEVHFRLLREDFLGPLRQKILNFNTKTTQDNNSSIFQYEDVRICDFEMSQDGVIYKLLFDQDKIDCATLENSTRLAFGSLLCLSNDNFETALFATVAAKNQNDLQKGIIKVRFESDLNSNNQQRYTMLESQAFFEAYRHVLKGLQSFNKDNLPLQNYLVNVQQKLEPPEYVKKNLTYYLKLDEANEDGERAEFGAQVLDINTWPTPEALNLDVFQRRAMHLALSSSLAIIQGPPGTGKTHVGLKIVEALLSNLRLTRCRNQSNPILVVCFTNHALDQFLEGIIKFTNRVVRLGSRSINPAMEPFTLREIMKGSVKSKLKREILDLKKQRSEAEKKVQKETNRLKLSQTRIIHELLLEKSLKEKDFQLIKTLKVNNKDIEPPFSFLGAWLGLINSDLVSEEDLQKFTQTKFTKDKTKDSINKNKNSSEKANDLNVYNAKTGKRVAKSRFAIRDWAVVVNVSENCEKIDKIDQVPLVSNLGKLCAAVVTKEFYKDDEMADDEIGNEKNSWKFDLDARWRLYRRWKRMFEEVQDELIKTSVVNYKEIAAKLEKQQNSEKIEILGACEIIGMTTTCAARTLDVLREIGPKIVIVEEAAEVLESHITTCMSKSTQHLILIGDHQQLRPGVNNHELKVKYNLDVSLFERMILNKVPFETLQLQHRMRSEISSLLVPHIYESLLDHPAVLRYPNVKGVAQNVFFLDHDIPEEAADGSTSHANRHEAEFLVSFCEYLLQQGYKRSQITILTPYSGQLSLMRRFTAAHIFEGVHTTVVDNFQGEENDIILLSFARSNTTDQIGFLKVHNRINVALSRAKLGLYCIGNFRHFARRSQLWRAIVADLERRNRIGPALTLVCQTHKFPTVVRNGREIKPRCPRGGCLY